MGATCRKPQDYSNSADPNKSNSKANIKAFTDLKAKIEELKPIMCLRRVREGILHSAEAVITLHDSIDQVGEKCEKVEKFGQFIQKFQYINIVGAKMEAIAAEAPEKLQSAKPYLADVYNVCLTLKEKHIKIINCIDTLDKFYKIIQNTKNKKELIGDQPSNGIRVLQWIIDYCPDFNCKVPQVQKNNRLQNLLKAMTALHDICAKIDEVQQAVLNKKFGTYKLADLIKKKDGEGEKKEEKKPEKDQSGLGGKMKIGGFGGFKGGSATDIVLNKAIKQAEKFVNEKITKVFDALIDKLVVGKINEQFQIPSDQFLDQEQEGPQEKEEGIGNEANKPQEQDDGYHRGTIGSVAQQFEEKKELVKKGKWFYVDIVVEEENNKVNLNKTQAKFVIEKHEEGEKKGFMEKVKEKGVELVKDKVGEFLEEKLG